MIVILTGGTGLIGQALIPTLTQQGYAVHLLQRNVQKSKSPLCRSFLWPSAQSPLPEEAFPKEKQYGVIHLMGEPVFQWPWTSSIKSGILSSRREGTKNLVSAFKRLQPPQFFISVSAMGLYGEQGDRLLTEARPVSDQNLFLQKVCKEWEREALQASSVCRTLIFRLGTVMSYKKGFLYEQAKWLKKGLFPCIISRKPCWLSWIALEDLTRLILWSVRNRQAKGVYNAVSPRPVSLGGFYKMLWRERAKRLTIPLPLPLFMARFLGGEMAKNLLLSAKARPERALSEGFRFEREELREVLKYADRV